MFSTFLLFNSQLQYDIINKLSIGFKQFSLFCSILWLGPTQFSALASLEKISLIFKKLHHYIVFQWQTRNVANTSHLLSAMSAIYSIVLLDYTISFNLTFPAFPPFSFHLFTHTISDFLKSPQYHNTTTNNNQLIITSVHTHTYLRDLYLQFYQL